MLQHHKAGSAYNEHNQQAEAEFLKEQAESAAAAATDLPKANGSSTTGEPAEAAQAAAAEKEAAAAAAKAAVEAEAKALKEELQASREALEVSEASRTETETLLAETKHVCAPGIQLVFPCTNCRGRVIFWKYFDVCKTRTASETCLLRCSICWCSLWREAVFPECSCGLRSGAPRAILGAGSNDLALADTTFLSYKLSLL